MYPEYVVACENASYGGGLRVGRWYASDRACQRCFRCSPARFACGRGAWALERRRDDTVSNFLLFNLNGY